MDRRTFLGVGAATVASTLAGCASNDAAVSDIVVGPAEYEVTADAQRTIRVDVTNQDGNQVGVTITDPAESVVRDDEIEGEGELAHDAAESGTFTVSVDTGGRTAVRIAVE